jgi:hypothetical protein
MYRPCRFCPVLGIYYLIFKTFAAGGLLFWGLLSRNFGFQLKSFNNKKIEKDFWYLLRTYSELKLTGILFDLNLVKHVFSSVFAFIHVSSSFILLFFVLSSMSLQLLFIFKNVITLFDFIISYCYHVMSSFISFFTEAGN